MKKKNEYENNKGITLIALIITIIVLLIFAGVAISMVIGNNGIITKTTTAVEEHRNVTAAEEIALAWASCEVDYNISLSENSEVKNKSNYFKVENLNKYLVGKGIVVEVKYKENGTSKVKYTSSTDANITEQIFTVDKNGKVTKENPLLSREGINVGDYVTYIAPTREDYELTNNMTGYEGNTQTLGQEYTTWRVLNINEDESMDLVATVVSSNKTIYFRGDLAYNNGVYVLNDMCSYLYNNESKGITARSLNIEDIEAHFSESGKNSKNNYISSQISNFTVDTNYAESKNTTNNTVTYKKARSYYPLIYKYQIGAGINTQDILKENDEYEFGKKAITESNPFYSTITTDAYEQTDSLTVKQTFYAITQKASYYDDYDEGTSNFYNTLFQTNTFFWLASRCSNCYDNYAGFCLNYINNSQLNGNKLYNSDSNTDRNYSHVCPLVSLSSNVQVKKCSGTNSPSNTHVVIIP